MKKTSDNKQVPKRCWDYLVEWQHYNQDHFSLFTGGYQSVNDLPVNMFWAIFQQATVSDYESNYLFKNPFKLNLEHVQDLYPGCKISGISEIYHPTRKWTKVFKDGTPILECSLTLENAVLECYKEGATIIQLKLEQKGEVFYPDYKLRFQMSELILE